MNTKITLVLILLVLISKIYAQQITLNNDSLRSHFQRETPYKVYELYERRSDDRIDYKALYYDAELKDYLMKWLDVNEYINYKVDKYKQNLYRDFEYQFDQKESFVRYYTKYSLNVEYDSIRSDTSLVKIYLAQAIEKRADEEKNKLINQKNELIPPFGVLYLHLRVAYPEFYKILKQWWYMQNKQVFLDDYDITETMICLVALNDSEAQIIFDNIIKRLFSSNWHPFFGTGILESLRYINNAYAVQKLIEIIPVTKVIETMSDGSTEPFDILVYKLLRQFMIEHNLQNNPFQSLNDLNQMRKNKDKIIDAANRLIEKLEADEQYWMENMPFDYIPIITSNISGK